MLIGLVGGIQDQRSSLDGLNQAGYDESAIQNESPTKSSPGIESSELPKKPFVSGVRRDSLTNVGQRRRSSASNQPMGNMRKG